MTKKSVPLTDNTSGSPHSFWESRFLFAATLLMLAFTGGVKGEEAFVSMKESGHGTYGVEGHFFVEASTSIAWAVLTDYDHIADFVSSMEQSRIKSRTGAVLLVEQKAKGEFFLFSRSVYVLLEIQEKPQESIQFEDTSHKDFDRYTGSWKLEATKEGVLVVYNLNVKSNFAVPGFVKRRVVKRSALELLEQVRSEIVKRSGRNL